MKGKRGECVGERREGGNKDEIDGRSKERSKWLEKLTKRSEETQRVEEVVEKEK